MTSKMTSKLQQSQRPPSGFYFKLHFWNQGLPLIKMRYRLFFLENFHFWNFQHSASEAANKFEKWKLAKWNEQIFDFGHHETFKWIWWTLWKFQLLLRNETQAIIIIIMGSSFSSEVDICEYTATRNIIKHAGLGWKKKS